MLFFVRSTWGNGKISRAQQCLVSHRRKNIVLEGAGVRVRCKDEEVEGVMFFNHILVSAPRTFGDNFSYDSFLKATKNGSEELNIEIKICP